MLMRFRIIHLLAQRKTKDYILCKHLKKIQDVVVSLGRRTL